MSFWANLRRMLFDFSQGQEEGRKLERILRVALAETTTEAEFHAFIYRMLREDERLRADYRRSLLRRLLSEHKGSRETDWRIAARRVIAYLPRFYGYTSDWNDENTSGTKD